jgi:hypothetical protein
VTTDLYDRDVHPFPRGKFPPPEPFVVERDVQPTTWIDERLLPFYPPDQEGVLIGHIVPSGFEAYARVFHPARRFFGRSIEQSASLRWSEIAEARGKVVHPQMQIEALIDNRDVFDYEYWKAISTGGGEWFPPYEWLEDIEGLALLGVLRSLLDLGSCLVHAVGRIRRSWSGHRRHPTRDDPRRSRSG